MRRRHVYCLQCERPFTRPPGPPNPDPRCLACRATPLVNAIRTLEERHLFPAEWLQRKRGAA